MMINLELAPEHAHLVNARAVALNIAPSQVVARILIARLEQEACDAWEDGDNTRLSEIHEQLLDLEADR